MFSEVSNTSKYAFILACEFLAKQGIVLMTAKCTAIIWKALVLILSVGKITLSLFVPNLF